MNGRALFTQLENFGDIDVSEDSVISWIHQGQREVSLEYPVTRTLHQAVTAGATVSVPDGVFKIVSAFFADGSEYPLTSIVVTGTTMTFITAGEVTVVYTSISPDYTNLDNELSINPAFHSHFLYYLISMYYDSDGEGDSEESALAERYYQKWVYYRNLALSALNNSDNSPAGNDPVATTDVLPRSRRAWGEDYYE